MLTVQGLKALKGFMARAGIAFGSPRCLKSAPLIVDYRTSMDLGVIAALVLTLPSCSKPPCAIKCAESASLSKSGFGHANATEGGTNWEANLVEFVARLGR
jgi:hypothetical protein